MEWVQHLLVYLTLAVAVGYLLWKFLLPKTLFSSKKQSDKGCGSGDCGCH
ncbi:MAG: hypothetical protein V7724_09765 [Sediminicola sp.]